MFSKPSVLSRNESLVRRDVRPAVEATPEPAKATLPEPNAVEAVPAPAIKEVSVGNAANDMGARLIVGPDVKLKGAEILDCDTLVVEGRVEATMDSRVLRIAENGAFSGTVSIDVAEIHGLFEGELTARERLVVHATGRINGKIRYGKIHIEEGGELSGDIKSLAAAGRDTTRDTPRAGERKDDTRPLAAIAG